MVFFTFQLHRACAVRDDSGKNLLVIQHRELLRKWQRYWPMVFLHRNAAGDVFSGDLQDVLMREPECVRHQIAADLERAEPLPLGPESEAKNASIKRRAEIDKGVRAVLRSRTGHACGIPFESDLFSVRQIERIHWRYFSAGAESRIRRG